MTTAIRINIELVPIPCSSYSACFVSDLVVSVYLFFRRAVNGNIAKNAHIFSRFPWQIYANRFAFAAATWATFTSEGGPEMQKSGENVKFTQRGLTKFFSSCKVASNMALKYDDREKVSLGCFRELPGAARQCGKRRRHWPLSSSAEPAHGRLGGNGFPHRYQRGGIHAAKGCVDAGSGQTSVNRSGTAEVWAFVS